MKRIGIAGLLIAATILVSVSWAGPIPPYVTPLWRSFLDETTAKFQADADSTTFFQVLDADGGTPVFNVDATNERVGIRTAVPAYGFDVAGSDTYGINLASGTWSSGVMNWDANPDVYANGVSLIHVDDTNYNVFYGTACFTSDAGTYNIGIGYHAGYRNSTTGNIAFGDNNVYIGTEAAAGSNPNTGYQNVAIGRRALYYNSTGSNNFALGTFALLGNDVGFSNIGIGYVALTSNGGGDENVGIGEGAGRYLNGGNDNTLVGTKAGYSVSTSNFSYDTCIGALSGYKITSGASNIFLGYKAGYNQSTNSNLLIIDNQDRTDVAGELAKSLVYGVFAADPKDQSMRINAAAFTLNGGTDTDITCNFVGTTTSGVMYWMEDEDYFKFGDDILSDAAEKHLFRDTAIGIYSQADTYMDLFADGGVRIGDSSAGAPTNYSKFEADGTLEFVGAATVWDDMRIVPGSFDRPGISDPAYVAYNVNGSGTSIYLLEWELNDVASFTVQLPHSYDQGEDISVHLHWTPGNRGNEENGATVGWKVIYSWANIDGTFGNPTTADLSDACGGTDHSHYMTPGVTITGSGKTMSSMLICNITRTDTGADDTWASSTSGQLPMLLEVDFHFPMDTVGSRTSGSK